MEALEKKTAGACPGFTLYWDDVREFAQVLTNEQIGRVIKMLCAVRDGKKKGKLTQAEKLVFLHLSNKIAEQEEKYSDTVNKNKQNAQKRYKKDVSENENTENASETKRKYTRKKAQKTGENENVENNVQRPQAVAGERMPTQTQTQTQNQTQTQTQTLRPTLEEREAFLRFRQIYPRKANLAAAEPFFYEAVKKIEPELLLRCLERQLFAPDWQREGGRFVPGAEKWLREECWLDVPEDPYDRIMRLNEEEHRRILEEIEAECL